MIELARFAEMVVSHTGYHKDPTVMFPGFPEPVLARPDLEGRRGVTEGDQPPRSPEQLPEPSWAQKVLTLNEHLAAANLPYAFGGAIALNYHREPRSTLGRAGDPRQAKPPSSRPSLPDLRGGRFRPSGSLWVGLAPVNSRNAPPVQLSPLSPRGRDLGDAAMVAARAFHHDPFFEYLDPDGLTRARGLALFFRATIASSGPEAAITGARQADGRLVGVSVVVPPGAWPLPVADQARQLAGGVRALVITPRALVRGAQYLFEVEKCHPKERLWYLLLLVVDPSVQRGGIGTLLQREMLERADSDGLDCYLETQKPENVPYYGRSGYEVEKELRPVRGGPPLFTMRRKPR